MQKSVFTKILDGELPGEVIYRDNSVAVLLTIEPFSEGHMLVVPIEPIDHIWDVPSAVYHHMWDIAREMAERLRASYRYKRIGTVVEGFGVPHAHIHVFGCQEALEDLMVAIHEQKRAGVHSMADPDDLKTIARRLRTE